MAGGADATAPSTRARGRRQQHQRLPLDVLMDIAAQTDPATLVRCAATCIDMRQRVKEYITLRRPLRLRQGDRFVPPLLRGNLIHRYGGWPDRKEELFLVDTSSPDATKLRKDTRGGVPLSSRDGLVLARVGATQELRVCNPATGRSMTLPSEPRIRWGSDINYVLLVGDHDDRVTAVGPHFKVVMACLSMLPYCPHLDLQTFSSDHGVWGPYTEILASDLRGSSSTRGLNDAVVVGDEVHWLCETNTGCYVLKLHVTATRVKVTMLPKSFPHRGLHPKLLATSSVGGDVILLVMESDKISAWAQSKHTAMWQKRPQLIIETDTILRFLDEAGETRPKWQIHLTLVWFAERRGIVLIEMSNYGFFWLDLQSKKIVRWFSDPHRDRVMYTTKSIPYDMSLMAWVPTFSSTL